MDDRDTRTNARGSRIECSFLACADRYYFDFDDCSHENSWHQLVLPG